MTGYIHSIESFGTVDGPGVRFVVFFQGCPLRCAYCHNPDTWERRGTPVTVEELLARFEKNRAFYSGGGLTATGGEPLMQLEFLTMLFECAKERGIHTCLDTSGALFRENKAYERLADATDLVLLDIKHMDPAAHCRLTGVDNERILEFARYLDRRHIPLWIRHVVVPGITDDDASLTALGRFTATLSSVQAVELLPYHTLGESKYESMHIPYPLQGVPPLSETAFARAKSVLQRAMQE
ncbi:MAG: pyruvate formate lyase-activating protein [Clostridia bacterium]|nr:pyruvate formate lyase-activating protein [Clostridia bacterium]